VVARVLVTTFGGSILASSQNVPFLNLLFGEELLCGARSYHFGKGGHSGTKMTRIFGERQNASVVRDWPTAQLKILSTSHRRFFCGSLRTSYAFWIAMNSFCARSFWSGFLSGCHFKANFL